MRSHRKMIECLLSLEEMCWRLATAMESFLLTIGQGLMQFVPGRRGRRLLSHKEIYVTNLCRLGKMGCSGRANGGIYIQRVGRLGLTRRLVVGQSRKDIL